MTGRFCIAAALSVVLLAACGEEDIILDGERFDLRAQPAFANQIAALDIPAAQTNVQWSHRNGSPSHTIRHPALGATLSPVFVADIGEGDSREARITSHPVVAGGVIYTVDARATVTATNVDGALLWTRNLTPSRDQATDASGGGISVAGGQVYVTTGFGEISALDAATGATIWVQDLDAPAKAAPTVRGDLVYVVARDSTAWALETSNGRVRWQQNATPSTANFGGGTSPATSGEYVVFPFSSGEVLTTYPVGGIPRWNTVVSGDRLGSASAVINDIAGDPVIVGEKRRHFGPQRNAGGPGQGREINNEFGLFLAGQGQRIGQDDPPFGIGMADFDGQALA